MDDTRTPETTEKADTTTTAATAATATADTENATATQGPSLAATATAAPDPTGVLDEALERLHAAGPEREGWLSNHAPMAVEALVRNGHAPRVHRWLDGYRAKLEDMPAPRERVTPDNWREALGDPARIADWAGHFERATAARPWREVLAEWWPRLLPGIAGGATHPVIRVGHAVRTLLTGEETAPRVTELAHALGYWAARHQPLPPLALLDPAPRAPGTHARPASSITPDGPAPVPAWAALDAVAAVPDQSAGIRHRLAQLTALPRWDADGADPETARARLTELVAAATHRYATHGHGEPVMLVHAATAPNAVLRALPALPRSLWAPSVGAAWAASAAVTAAYTPAKPAPYAAGAAPDPGEVFERAAAHGDDHAIKFADTALDVGDPLALTAAALAVDLIDRDAA
ncbi:questin oxidase family protein [Streptomyces fradiae]|uniref:questin oxidase family protein n=1 Tax=Streptomyces fradiae TaxID=1906 RepID=UPI0035BE93AF